ncbi:RNB domain-containing ribonuclease [Actinokineospora globicatena]|uniref:Ribonuclease R n=1 Tax=Actinokineospora globicatena TaxID=103729 RepID=A0A9W6QMZ7_9PSEU|nr:RNB domain-containing ribonuclease [Actinokineospora globicatena]GLW92547.1 ribonuclease R [Actinokineospora globicatena]
MDSSANATGGDFARVRADFDLPDQFPPAALTEAEQAVSDGPRGSRVDATDIPFVTIDPPGAKDLDQALCLSRLEGGYRLHYAIADLGAFLVPDGALDTVARERGQTMYLPDGNVPLHPTVLSEGAASLLPDERRAAALWTIDLDTEGQPVSADVKRAWIRSVAQFDYATVQADIDAGREHPSVTLLPEVGSLRRSLAIKRGAVELQLPEQDVDKDGDTWGLVLRTRTAVDAWNAELSLLTGMCAAQIMLRAKVGVLRTLPPADDNAVEWLHRSAAALGIEWPPSTSTAELLAGLDPADPAALALFMDATRLLRGAGYTVFDGDLPELVTHAGIAAAYAHVTAPLRRLVDRFGTEICLAVCAGEPVADWVRAALPALPGLMESSDTLAAKVDRASLDQVEAWVLEGKVGAEFDAVVLRAEATVAEIFIPTPPVLAKAAGEGLREGESVRVRLTAVDPVRRRVAFERA